MVLSTSRIRGERLLPRLAMKADSSSSAACRFEPVGAEHLVPVVADPTTGPAVPAAAAQTHRVGAGCREKRFRCRGAPVDQKATTRAVGEAEPSDVHGLGAVGADHAAEADVQAEATQQAQAGGQPVNLQVPVYRRSPLAPRGLALGVEAVGQVGDLLLEALRDSREVLLVAGNQRRVGLGDKTLGKVEHIGGHGNHVTISDPNRCCPPGTSPVTDVGTGDLSRLTASIESLPTAVPRVRPSVRRPAKHVGRQQVPHFATPTFGNFLASR